jgi:hypothetical protein
LFGLSVIHRMKNPRSSALLALVLATSIGSLQAPTPPTRIRTLLGVIETSTHTGLRDRALLGTQAYTFARIGAVVNLKVEDYYPSGKRFLLRFREKGG